MLDFYVDRILTLYYNLPIQKKENSNLKTVSAFIQKNTGQPVPYLLFYCGLPNKHRNNNQIFACRLFLLFGVFRRFSYLYT